MATRFFANDDFKMSRGIYRKTVRATVLFVFFAGLAAAVFYFFHKDDKTASQKDFVARQSAIFADWYAGHQKRLAALGHQWRTFSRIQRDFQLDIISIEETYVRLTELKNTAIHNVAELKDGVPPLSLEGEVYDRTGVIYHRSLEYARAQYNAINEAAKLADKERFGAAPQETQSRNLRELAARLDPVALFIEKDLARVREILRN